MNLPGNARHRPLVFSVVEDDGENVTIKISEKDYQLDLAAGIDEEAMLKPGREMPCVAVHS